MHRRLDGSDEVRGRHSKFSVILGSLKARPGIFSPAYHPPSEDPRLELRSPEDDTEFVISPCALPLLASPSAHASFRRDNNLGDCGVRARAAAKAPVWVVTHSDILADALEEETGKRPGRIIKADGATTIEGLTIGGDYGEG